VELGDISGSSAFLWLPNFLLVTKAFCNSFNTDLAIAILLRLTQSCDRLRTLFISVHNFDLLSCEVPCTSYKFVNGLFVAPV
jgi:hypothetical protein